MKKLCLMLLLVSVLFAASCGKQEQETAGNQKVDTGNQIGQESTEETPVTCKELEAIDLEQSAVPVTKDLKQELDTLVYFDDTKLVYFIDKYNKDSPDTGIYKIYLYNWKTGENKCLMETPDVHCSMGDIRILDQKLYYAFGYLSGDKEYNRLLEVDLENSTAKLIPIEDANIPFANIAVTDRDVFLLKRNNIDENRTDYSVERLEGEKFTEVARKTWDGEKGEAFCNIYGEEELLYVYGGTSDDEDYFLCMTRDGEVKREDSIDIAKYMKLEMEDDPEMEEEDSPWEIMKQGNYYMISTLNQRIILFKIEEQGLTPIKVPVQLDSKDLAYGVKPIMEYKQGSRYVFFQETLEKSVYVFDSKTGEFGHFDIKVKGELEYIMQNGEEQFLFQVRRKDDTVDYLLYERKDGWEF